MTADGSGPPASLLKQDAKEELQAHYLDGDIDEEELEMLMEEALEGDDE